jgi:cytochrome b involved in lipid metabolism
MEKVRANNTPSSCWTVIDGYVYDLTKWINSHPGGPSAIRGLCGTDGTKSFKSQHESEAQAAQRLSLYLLGPLNG